MTEEERSLLNGERADPALLVPKAIREKVGLVRPGSQDPHAGYSEIRDPVVDPEK